MNVKQWQGDPAQTASGEAAAAGDLPPISDLTTVLQALGDPVRLAIVRDIAEEPDGRYCGSFGLPVTKSTLSHHFKVLREAGVILGRYEGTRKLLSLRRADLDAAYPGLLDSILRAPMPQLDEGAAELLRAQLGRSPGSTSPSS
jgi:DNA-binding transcriptional ArsR family regulator